MATMEDVANPNSLSSYTQYYYNADYTVQPHLRHPRVNVSGYPTNQNITNPNDYVVKLRGDGQKIGPSTILKVMAGDKVNLYVSSWWKQSSGTFGKPATPLNQLVSALSNTISSMAGGKATSAQLLGSTGINDGAQTFSNTR